MAKAKCGWIVRLYAANDYQGTIDLIGNYKEYHNRMKDDVTVFSGMYGIDDYMIWQIHKNLGNYDFAGINIDLKLFIDQNTNRPFWHKQYKVLDVTYDSDLSKYILYAMGLDSVKLKTKLIDYGVKSLSWSENRTPKQVLIEVLQDNDIFYVEYMVSPYEQNLKNFEYRYFDIDENWTVEDFINYIADQNEFEWYVRNGVLYISNECKAIKAMNATRKFDLETDNISSTAWFKKYYGETRPMDVMAHISETWRCVWAKHSAGDSGGISKGCFTKIGIGTLDKENYLKTLEGEMEKRLATKLFIDNSRNHYITLGNIIKDTGWNDYIDEVSMQKNKELFKVNEPSDIKIDRGDEATSPLTQTKKEVCRSTPYLDANGGILFPSPWLAPEADKDFNEDNHKWKGNPPNVIIFQVDGKRESSVVGPYVMGNSEVDFKEQKTPTKRTQDFRFSLPNGWTMYVDAEFGKTLFQVDGVPTNLGCDPDERQFPFPGDESKNPYGQERTYIYMRPLQTESNDQYNEISMNVGLGNQDEEVGSKLRLRSHETGSDKNCFYFVTKDAENEKEVMIEVTKEKIILTAKEGDSNINKIEIDAYNLTINVEAQEIVNIIADDGSVNITSNSEDVNIESTTGKVTVTADSDITVNSANGKVDVDADGDITLDSASGKVTATGSTEVKLTVGGSSITITSSSITLTAGGVTATLSGGVMDVT